MAHNAKLKKRLLRKDEIQGTAKNTWSEDEAKGTPARPSVKTSERYGVCPRVLFQTYSQTKGL